MSRRTVLALGAALALAARASAPGEAAAAQAGDPSPGDHWGPPEPFRPALVRRRARALAEAPYEPVPETLPDGLAALSYDQYRDIRFRPEAAIWADRPSPAQVQLFHVGFGYRTPVTVNVVERGESRRLIFDPAMFSYGPLVPEPPTAVEDLGFSGFRLHAPLNRDDFFDEFAVFQGASYFRAVAAGQVYGLSARGLAIGVADPNGEEFPVFREFWIEEPPPEGDFVVVHALLDSPSAAGAYRFVIRQGAATTMEVEASLYPRAEIASIGVAPLTSMFFFAPHDRVGVDDFRGAVHDSDGLLVWNGSGEWIWRPLLNPETLQISAFLDDAPHGFGLMQRARAFADYQDLEADYHRRPSLWVEPVGDWGRGAVMLVEIPTRSEFHDNVVAFWRPEAPIAAGSELQLAYRLHWRVEPPVQSGLARVARTFSGFAVNDQPADGPRNRVFVIDFAGDVLDAAPGEPILAQVHATGGALREPVVKADPELPGVRVSIEIDPQGEDVIELRCVLVRGGAAISESWLYRWLA